ncbi:hypothetical protein FH063_002183 [Azospirillum argentinense]|uniref:Uncharacterized protein n=1 Tax=Azospirillum argentinense TaxID=2970906 RepID=A0A5B0KR90_9PROT|nr:hypothetical protein FH063_002183 [Azospirillum argentinense]
MDDMFVRMVRFIKELIIAPREFFKLVERYERRKTDRD